MEVLLHVRVVKFKNFNNLGFCQIILLLLFVDFLDIASGILIISFSVIIPATVVFFWTPVLSGEGSYEIKTAFGVFLKVYIS